MTPLQRPHARRAATVLLTAVAGAAVIAAPDVPAAEAQAPTKHVVVIGVDGLMFDKIAPVDAPVLDGLIAGGYRSKTWLSAAPMALTKSGPGWATNLTGVWPDKHRVYENNWTNSDITAYPDFLTLVERADPAYRTYAASVWNPILDGSAGPPLITREVDTRYDSPTDQDVTDKAVAHLRSTGPHATFIHLDDVDLAGHGCGAAGACYAEAVEAADRRIGQIVNAPRSRPTYAQESWTFIITSDHGHTPSGGHGGNTPDERRSLIIKSGPGVTPGEAATPAKNVDIAADVLAHFGIPRPAAFDGRPLATPTTDAFESAALKARQDETAIPADVRGWTHTAPAGWSIETTAAGGVTEWRGWSLTTDDFWTKAQAGQQRENNVRARGVFAVADSDEWADKAYTGTFASTMTTPAAAVRGRSSVDLTFGSHHVKADGETARVTVSFDGGAPKQVLAYTGDAIAKREKVTVAVPSGAKWMTAAFTLSGTANGWYWAIDDVSVTPTTATHEITVQGTSQAVDVPGASTALSTQLALWSRHGGANQRFTFTPHPDGSYEIRGANGLCVDVQGGSTAPGAAIIQWHCTGSANQRWHVTADFAIRSESSGLVLTAASTANSATLTQQPDTGAATQRWSFQ